MTKFGAFFSALKGLFSKNLNLIIDQVYNVLPSKQKAEIGAIIAIVAKVDAYIESPTADVLVALIPSNIDNILLLTLRKSLPIILKGYNEALTYDQKHVVASKLIQAYDPNYSFGQAVVIAESVFKNTIGKVA